MTSPSEVNGAMQKRKKKKVEKERKKEEREQRRRKKEKKEREEKMEADSRCRSDKNENGRMCVTPEIMRKKKTPSHS